MYHEWGGREEDLVGGCTNNAPMCNQPDMRGEGTTGTIGLTTG